MGREGSRDGSGYRYKTKIVCYDTKTQVSDRSNQEYSGTFDGTVPPTQLRLFPVLPGGGAAGTGTNRGRDFPDPDPEIPAGTHL